MTTAVDTSVLLDILTNDPVFGAASEVALRAARQNGRTIVSDVVVAEIRPALRSSAEVESFLSDMNLEVIPSTQESGLLAGETFAAYLRNRGQAKRVLPDFLVAAHARCFADALLARDRGYYRTYFSDLALQEPKTK